MEKIKEFSAEVFYTLYEQFSYLFFRLKVKCKRSCIHDENKKSEDQAKDPSNEPIHMMENDSTCLSSVD